MTRAVIEDYKIEILSSEWTLISCKETAGVHILALKNAIYKAKYGAQLGNHRQLSKRDRGELFQFKSKKGITIDPEFFKGNGFQVKAPPEKALELLQYGVEKANAEHESRKNWKASEPERKREASQIAAAERKKLMAAYDEQYGKGTWKRVTYRQEDGDDGYCYVVRVDGRAKWDGLTQHQAAYYKRAEVEDLAKREKLGRYAI